MEGLFTPTQNDRRRNRYLKLMDNCPAAARALRSYIFCKNIGTDILNCNYRGAGRRVLASIQESSCYTMICIPAITIIGDCYRNIFN